MNLVELALAPLVSARYALARARLRRRWAHLRRLGMHLGNAVNLPASTLIDDSHCFLISIGDFCGFGEQCHILAHDAQMNEYLNATRLGRVTIHESCHIGARTVILPGVEIGPRTIIGANSVVSRSLPPETVCAGTPARPLCSLDEYLTRHRDALARGPTFDFVSHDIGVISQERKAAMIRALAEGDGYMVGGYPEMLSGRGGPMLTPPAD
jgi:maltose O-acetyltransferase